MAAADLVELNHIARESSDVKRLAAFYQQILGFEQMDTPNFGDVDVIWLRISPSLSMHIIQRDPQSSLPVSPYATTAASSVIRDPKQLSRGHHLSFSVSNFDSFVQTLKEKGIEVFQKTQPDGKTKQVFFFDPDGNGLEVMSRDAS
ncbi:Lactoylglutathione lyase / glyoxalase I family protein [Rhynchospora pubera]|uniref:Lactoylglutathione lyase / glyoxalase I family protein n=1 Tax=Rhynchospora pubera TaxID=906938 RepID=A0AAV8HH38_9POAL|nr:Lactoylglutathione lyase / glyoxalase I family protein [Rhynchospora pubera]